MAAVVTIINIFVGTYILVDVVGSSGFAGVLMTAAIVYGNARLSLIVGQWTGKKLKVSDERISSTAELINGIRVVKFMAWESSVRRPKA